MRAELVLPSLQCAWCGRLLRKGDPTRTSHGICPSCLEVQLARVKR